MPAFDTLMAKVSNALERDAVPYMVIGGQAVVVHGEPRFTRDIDITLGIYTEEMERIFKITRELSLEPLKGVTEDFVKRTALLSVEDKETRLVVDFIFSFLPYERQAIQRAKPVHIGRTSVRFATAEDTIIHKLFSARPIDIADVKSIISTTRDLDNVYLKKWLKEFSGVAGRDLVKEYGKIEAEVGRVETNDREMGLAP
jgi:hypothetical protein